MTAEDARDRRIVAGLLKGEKLCDHPDSWLTGYGNNFSEPFSMVLCTCCLLQGPKGKDYADAKELFWKKEALDRGRYLKLMKEMKPMSTDDYKRGVEDATKPVTEKSLYYFTDVNDLLKSRRKSLLRLLPSEQQTAGEKFMSTSEYKRGVEEATKELIEGTLPSSRLFKVAFDMEMSLRRKSLLTERVTKWIIVNKKEQDVYYPGTTLYDNREEANKGSLNGYGECPSQVLGIFPIEIEVPL